MNKRIVYKNPETNKLSIVFINEHLCDVNHPTRRELESRGITFNSDDEIIKWVAEKDIPKGIQYYIVDAENMPKDFATHDNWYYHKESNSVRDS